MFPISLMAILSVHISMLRYLLEVSILLYLNLQVVAPAIICSSDKIRDMLYANHTDQ